MCCFNAKSYLFSYIFDFFTTVLFSLLHFHHLILPSSVLHILLPPLLTSHPGISFAPEGLISTALCPSLTLRPMSGWSSPGSSWRCSLPACLPSISCLPWCVWSPSSTKSPPSSPNGRTWCGTSRLFQGLQDTGFLDIPWGYSEEFTCSNICQIVGDSWKFMDHQVTSPCLFFSLSEMRETWNRL